ncbi:FkbM family methyltransferase [Saccharolobus islandicus]|uniref:FkbM family methyltransferase n=1 Tax=Saccharolobus islandicus TaxID=43080 RepID=UPI000375AC95|nr:FkbM family methyltransferase [Sulfolobus islandicus]
MLNCTVYSFEPNPNSFKLLSLNVLDNKFNNVKLYNVALGDREGEVFINHNFDETHVSLNGYKMKMITLDSLNLNKINLLKIDVEGFEKEVLLGRESTLERTDKVIIEVHEHNKNFVDAIMRNHGLVKEKEELTYTESSIYYILYDRKR